MSGRGRTPSPTASTGGAARGEALRQDRSKADYDTQAHVSMTGFGDVRASSEGLANSVDICPAMRHPLERGSELRSAARVVAGGAELSGRNPTTWGPDLRGDRHGSGPRLGDQAIPAKQCTVKLTDGGLQMAKLNFADLKDDYSNLCASMVIRQDKLPEVNAIVRRILDHRDRYRTVEGLTKVPWYAIAIIHNLESGGKLSRRAQR